VSGAAIAGTRRSSDSVSRGGRHQPSQPRASTSDSLSQSPAIKAVAGVRQPSNFYRPPVIEARYPHHAHIGIASDALFQVQAVWGSLDGNSSTWRRWDAGGGPMTKKRERGVIARGQTATDALRRGLTAGAALLASEQLAIAESCFSSWMRTTFVHGPANFDSAGYFQRLSPTSYSFTRHHRVSGRFSLYSSSILAATLLTVIWPPILHKQYASRLPSRPPRLSCRRWAASVSPVPSHSAATQGAAASHALFRDT